MAKEGDQKSGRIFFDLASHIPSDKLSRLLTALINKPVLSPAEERLGKRLIEAGP